MLLVLVQVGTRDAMRVRMGYPVRNGDELPLDHWATPSVPWVGDSIVSLSKSDGMWDIVRN